MSTATEQALALEELHKRISELSWELTQREAKLQKVEAELLAVGTERNYFREAFLFCKHFIETGIPDEYLRRFQALRPQPIPPLPPDIQAVKDAVEKDARQREQWH